MSEHKQAIQEMLAEVREAAISTKEELETYRIKFIGSKGKIKDLFGKMKEIAADERKSFGAQVNALKQEAEDKFEKIKSELSNEGGSSEDVAEDLTLPAPKLPLGSRHPISIVRNQICEIFARIGFSVSEGPEIVNDWNNFTALNIPEDHPARDMQDTYFVSRKPDYVLRTHTSSVQVKVMESEKPPIRTISPGRVYRNETISARAHCQFHQVEGLYIDKGVSFADLKQCLYYFATEMFGEGTKIQFRPSYFPFTEPSAEMDVTCLICKGEGCPVCKYTGWVEILGCGMVDPSVLQNCKIDHEEYSGFAFGMGIERITMLKYGIDDIRLLFENDSRFLKQFAHAQ